MITLATWDEVYEWEDTTEVVSDDEGNWWAKCGDKHCDLEVVYPGCAQCCGLCNGLEGWAYREEHCK